MMRAGLWIIALGLCAGCGKEARNTKTEAFFVDWLKAHGETNIVSDSKGVGLTGNATRLKASIYDSKKHADGRYVVETEFRIRMPSGGEIVEFVAGIGDTEAQAINDSLLNFTLTTFHVVYKGFMNPADPHQTLRPITLNGQPRQIAMGDIYMRSGKTNQTDLNLLRPKIEDAIGRLTLSPQPHWIKIVYGHVKTNPPTVSVTLDNEEHPSLTAAIKDLPWPEGDDFYMVKQFIVIK